MGKVDKCIYIYIKLIKGITYMKKFNLAAVTVAVVGSLTAGSAFAGTAACFEVYKGADNAAYDGAENVYGFDTTYTPASCTAQSDLATGVAATEGNSLLPTNEAKIAYELTGDLTVDFDAVDGTDTDLQIVYIPTTDVPPGTLITMQLTGATFAGNADLIHLVQYDQDAADGSFEAVASSDGDVDGEGEITFLTKSGVTIGAGTRLVFSRVSSGAAEADIDPVGIHIANTGCTDPDSTETVTIAATSAVTDGGTGYDIIGAVSSAQLVADISAQFRTFVGVTATDGEVNAESEDSFGNDIISRTEFVYEDSASDKFTLKQHQLITAATFVDYGANNAFDQSVDLDADDYLSTTFVTDADAGTYVKAGIFDVQDASTGNVSDQIGVETGVVYGTLNTATPYETQATSIFTDGIADDGESYPSALASDTAYGQSNTVYYVLENRPANGEYGVMNFNYAHTPEYTLEFNEEDTLLDHCTTSKNLHNVAVNGAVLKVPYAYDTANNWIRITNENSEDAVVTMDIFDEDDHTAPVTVILDEGVSKYSSTLYLADDLIDQAVEAGFTRNAEGHKRYTMTFTVTAPSNTVHGVSVQKIAGGVDRVLPVLDMNDWSE